MKFSIIIPTLGRVTELRNLLESISNQEFKDFELIIIDQNTDNILEKLIDDFIDRFPVQWVKISKLGASNARNVGASLANGDILCFPDDDSELSYGVLSLVNDLFKSNDFDCIFGKVMDNSGNDSINKFSDKAGMLNINNFSDKFVEATMFIRNKVFRNYKFDSNLGVGTFFGAEEGRDIVYRMLIDNIKIYYDPNIVLYHPQKIIDHLTYEEFLRVFKYRCGYGYFCEKHKRYKEFYSRLILLILYLVFLILTLNKKSKYYYIEILGMLIGKSLYK